MMKIFLALIFDPLSAAEVSVCAKAGDMSTGHTRRPSPSTKRFPQSACVRFLGIERTIIG
jgi:hypothetical protein